MSSDEEDLSAEPLQLQQYLLTQNGLSRQLQWSAEMFCRNRKKINVLTPNRTTTHRHSDELRNLFFKNNPGKIASLKNVTNLNVSKMSASWKFFAV